MKEGLTKARSGMIKGLAILMMLYHHLFVTPDALGVSYRSVLFINGVNVEYKLALFFKICVGLYAFVSGYGLCRSLNRPSPYEKTGRFLKDHLLGCYLLEKRGFFKKIIDDYRTVLKKFLSFYLQYLLVFAIYVPIGFIFFGKVFDTKEFFLNLFGLSSSYNGAWWYVLQYFKMIMVLPLVDCFFSLFEESKDRLKQLVFYVVIFGAAIASSAIEASSVFSADQIAKTGLTDPVILTVLVESLQPAFLSCFLMGYFIARFNLYELAYKIFTFKNEKSGQMILYYLGFVAVVLVIACRMRVAKDASSAGLDFVFVPVFVFGFAKLTEMFPGMCKFFAFFGTYSTFIWLTHVFYYDHYLKNVVLASRISTFIYLTLLAISTVSAVLLVRVYNLARRPFINEKRRQA